MFCYIYFFFFNPKNLIYGDNMIKTIAFNS